MASIVIAVAIVAGCSAAKSSPEVAPEGLIALTAETAATSLVGWEASGGEAIPITLPKGEPVWVASGRGDVLVLTLASGGLATSDPLHLGTKLAWRTVKAVGPTGDAPKGPDFFAVWDPQGGRFATLAGDLVAGDQIRVVLIDPSVGSAFEIPIDRPVLAAPPAWIDGDRLVVVTGDAAQPASLIVDTTTGASTEGPIGARLLASSANARRIATMAGQGAPVLVHDMAGWLAGDGSSVASIDPPSGSATAISLALDATGQRLAIAWLARDGTVTLAVHDAASAWRRVAQPRIGSAHGAVVAWRR